MNHIRHNAPRPDEPPAYRFTLDERDELAWRRLDRQAPQHFLYFLPLPQGQRSFRPTLGCVLRMSVCGARELEAWTGGAGQLESGAEDAARALLCLRSEEH